MAKAWGGSWADAWGASWGSSSVVVLPDTHDGGKRRKKDERKHEEFREREERRHADIARAVEAIATPKREPTKLVPAVKAIERVEVPDDDEEFMTMLHFL